MDASKTQMTIDRFEGDIAVALDQHGRTFNIESSQLPQGAKVGDTLVQKGGKLVIDHATTDARAARIAKKMKGRFI